MLDQTTRTTNYLAQTGKAELTARQRRRVKHKRGHQPANAVAARESRAAITRKTNTARKNTARELRRAAHLPL